MTPSKTATPNNQLFEALTAALSNPSSEEITTVLRIFENLSSGTSVNSESLESSEVPSEPPVLKPEIIDNNYNGSEMEVEEGEEVMTEEMRRYNNRRSSQRPRETERLRQMAKNREYARKCVQKKKDQRKDAEIRCKNMKEQMETLRADRIYKERNAEFAVFLGSRNNSDDVTLLETKKKYDEDIKNMEERWKKLEAEDELVNVNYARLASATEEFHKASIDLREKNGVIGTLGSRKIRAKQHMEWRSHLYNLSLFEHHLERDTQLAQLADDYVASTIPKVSQLLPVDGNQCSISKELLDELITTNKGPQLAEFVQFVQNSLVNK